MSNFIGVKKESSIFLIFGSDTIFTKKARE